MKRAMILLLVSALLTLAATGCGQSAAKSAYEADNEIVTYQKIDPQKTQVVVSRTGNISVEPFCVAFEEQNPDIQIVYLDITGGNATYKPLVDWITRGYVPDVVFSASSFFDETLTTDYFECLSLDPITQSYEAAALKRTAVDDDVYSLPGPSNISAMMYNKTLFDRYGWEVPVTFDAFVALCDQIRADTNGEIEPWNPNAKYDQELQTALEAMTYEELFGGAENRAWYNDLAAGKATFSGHMEPYMDVLQTLIDHDILREEHFTYSATTRGKEFEAGKIAMVNMNIYDADNADFDFSYMPFPTTQGELGYLSDRYSCFVSLPVKEHTEAENEAIARLLAYFTSAEGQRIYIGNSMMVSNVKDVPLNQSDDLAALKPAIDAGHLFEMLNFGSVGSPGQRISLQQCAMDMTAGTMTGTECIAAEDAKIASPAEETVEEPPETLASVAKDMTILETSFYIADAYREAAGAEIGLIANNHAFRGNLMRLFSGAVTPSVVTVLKPRSFENGSTLVRVSMTGRQLLDALNHPLGNEDPADCVYAYSGLKCKVAPWNKPGEKYLSVKLSDGSELIADKLYTVAIWAGTVDEAYVTETLEVFEGSFEELMTAKLQSDGTVAPADDGRIQLVWN